MATLDELGAFLEDDDVATVGTDLFLAVRPDKPDTCLSLFLYPGGPPEYVQSSYAPNAERVQLQVVARAVHYEDAEALAISAWKVLSVVVNATLSGTHYRSIRPNNSPASMGRDQSDRSLVFFNATVEKEVSS